MPSFKSILLATLITLLFLSCDQEIRELPYLQTASNLTTSNNQPELTGTSILFFGPQRFYNEGGSSEAMEVEFNLPPCFQPEVLLTIDNGDGSYAVSSAIIALNDEVVFSQSDFNKKVTTLESSSQLQLVNKLTITINGQPGSFLDVSFSGTVEQGLVACYPFNGDALDASGNNNHGTAAGTTTTTDRLGNTASAYEFDGADDYVDIPNFGLFDGSQNYSMSAWVNSYGFENERKIISFRGERNVFLGTNVNPDNSTGTEELLFFTFDGDRNYVDAGTIELNSWYHVVATYSTNDGMKIYVNGMLVDRNTYTGSPDVGSLARSNQIGGYVDSPVHFWKGKIDDVKIYNRTLSQYEIESEYGLLGI